MSTDLTPESEVNDTGGKGPRVFPEESRLEPLPEVLDSHRSYSVDPVTGMVEGGQRGGGILPVDRKEAVLLTLRKYWPNVSRACALAGMAYKTYKSQLELDLKFRQAVEDIKREVLDDLEGLGAVYAATPKGFMHWIAMLKAHRPERWNPDQQLLIKHELAPEQVRLKRDNLAEVIAADAIVIEATTGRKPPELPDLTPKPETEAVPPDNPGVTAKDTQTASVPPTIPADPLPVPDNQQDIDQQNADGLAPQLLDSLEDFCNTSSAPDMDISKLIGNKHLPPKKPTGHLIDLDPLAPSPSTKIKRGVIDGK